MKLFIPFFPNIEEKIAICWPTILENYNTVYEVHELI